MSLSILNSFNNQPTEQSNADKARDRVSKEQQSFLKILITQLKCQTPDKAVDQQEMTQLMVGFNAVEQQIQTNINLEQIVAMNKVNHLNSTSSFIGKTAKVLQDKADLIGNSAEFNYTLTRPSVATNLNILDHQGSIIYSAPGEKNAGKHDFTWDGRDIKGKKYPDGSYRLQVNAVDEYGSPIAVKNLTIGKITRANLNEAQPSLTIDNKNYRLEEILSIESAEEDSGQGLESLNQSTLLNNTINCIGKKIEADFSTIQLKGQADIYYNLSENAKDAKINITNNIGEVVARLDADKTAGNHRFNWNGFTEDGHKVADGQYKVQILAVNSQQMIEASPSIKGVVNEINNSNGRSYVYVGDHKIELNRISKVADNNLAKQLNLNQDVPALASNTNYLASSYLNSNDSSNAGLLNDFKA